MSAITMDINETSSIMYENEQQLEYDGHIATDATKLLNAKIITMTILCIASFILGIIPVKLVKLFHILSSSSNSNNDHNNHIGHGHGHGHNITNQPLIVTLLLSFGGGVLLYTTFLHLQPSVRENMQHIPSSSYPEFITKYHVPLPDLIFCVGFFLVYMIEELVHIILDNQSHEREDEAVVLHRTMSINRCSHRWKPKTGALIPRVTLNNNAAYSCSGKSEAGDNSLLSISTISKQELLNHAGQSTSNNSNNNNNNDNRIIIDTDSSADNEHEKIVIPVSKSFRGLFVVLALSFHEIFEGLAVGLETNSENVWYLFVAIATHKLVISFCVGLELVSTRTKFPIILIYVSTFAIVTPIGSTLGIFILSGEEIGNPESNILTVILQGVAAGTLLYVVFFEVLQREKSNNRYGMLQWLAIVVGFTLMLLMQILTGHQHSHGQVDHHSEEHHHHHHHDHDH